MIHLLLLLACGVEETGYFTDEGVFLTEDSERSTRLLVVRPDAVAALGGELSGSTSEGEELPPQMLSSDGVVWLVEGASSVSLTYTLDGESETTDIALRIDAGSAPVEDTTGLQPWIRVGLDALVVTPEGLEGTLPFLVVNQDGGASIVIDGPGERDLPGTAGDRVCAASLIGDSLTPSLCEVVE